MPLYNRSTSLMSSGGITNRSGGNTQEIYNSEASIPQQPEQNTSSGKSWFGKAWDWAKEHAKGIGKVLNAGATIGAAALGGPAGLAGLEAVKAGAGLIGDELKGTKAGKFISGFTNESVSSKANKAYDTLANKGLDKTGKFLEIARQLKSYKTTPNQIQNSVLTNTSNGHVPTGYQATSSQGATPVSFPTINKRKNRKRKNKK